MLSSRELEIKTLSKYFNKKIGAFTYSGTLALELALLNSGFNEGDSILLPNNVCYRILFSILKLKGNPIIVKPQNNLVLTGNDVKKVLSKEKVKFLILAHQYGIPVNVGEVRKICSKNTIIIEDAAQAWDVQIEDQKIGDFSDYVITSFGATKPLSLGIGGGVFSNNTRILDITDELNSLSRYSNHILYPYLLPESVELNIDQLINNANKKIKKQRSIADLFIDNISNLININIYIPNKTDKFNWHKFPLWTDSKDLFDRLCQLLDECNINYEKAFKTELQDLPILKNYKYEFFDFSKKELYFLFIKSNNNLLNLKKWIKNLP